MNRERAFCQSAESFFAADAPAQKDTARFFEPGSRTVYINKMKPTLLHGASRGLREHGGEAVRKLLNRRMGEFRIVFHHGSVMTRRHSPAVRFSHKSYKSVLVQRHGSMRHFDHSVSWFQVVRTRARWVQAYSKSPRHGVHDSSMIFHGPGIGHSREYSLELFQ